MSRRRIAIVSVSGGTALRSFSLSLAATFCLLAGCAPPLTDLRADGADAPELLAVFDLSRDGGDGPADPRRSFYLWRERHRIVYATEGEDVLRIWRRDTHGHISHLEAWMERGIVVEYVPGDLRALGAMPVWEDLQGLVERVRLDADLRRRGSGGHRGLPATRYAGSVEETDLELTWIPSLRLAAELEERRDGTTTRLELRQVYRLRDAPWRPPDLGSLRTVDFADLGDAPPDLVPHAAGAHGAHE